jgi:tRNA 2-thiouridine synthesizing protein A
MAKIDANGKRCPLPIVMLAREIKTLEPGSEIEILADDPVFEPDLKSWIKKTGHELISLEQSSEGKYAAIVRKK